jgi:membrane fusion protein (multidrug efflux system)
LLILGPLALVVGGLGLYLATGRYVTEEDAYVQAVNASISPQVSGQVMAIAAKSNREIKKEDPLFNLDPEPYQIALANAEAQLGVARDQAHTLIETYRSRLKQIDQAKATVDYAQRTFERQQQLYDTGAAPRATLDAAIRDLQTAKGQSGKPGTGSRGCACATGRQSRHACGAAIRGEAGAGCGRFRCAQSAAHLHRRAFRWHPEQCREHRGRVFLNAGQSAFPLVSTHDLYVEANIRETAAVPVANSI